MKLYVGNLSFETTENDLQDLFEKHGTVNEVHLMMDKMTGKSRGFAFVTMNDGAQAGAAMSSLNGQELNGRALNVNEARPREDRPRPYGANCLSTLILWQRDFCLIRPDGRNQKLAPVSRACSCAVLRRQN